MATSAFRTFSAGSSLLVLNTAAGVLTELSPIPGCHIVNQELLTATDVYVLLPLLESFPHYVPYALLLSAISDEPLDFSFPAH